MLARNANPYRGNLPPCSDGGLLKNRCGLELSEVGEIGDVLVGTQRTVTIAIRYTLL